MKAIIISDADARALLDSLELAALRPIPRAEPAKPTTVEDIHRAFHYVVTRWLQEQGADTVRR
jgi:hypothetical protein